MPFLLDQIISLVDTLKTAMTGNKSQQIFDIQFDIAMSAMQHLSDLKPIYRGLSLYQLNTKASHYTTKHSYTRCIMHDDWGVM